jgi:TatD DNase family protein
MWVDSHCHIQLADEDPLALLERAPEVDWLVAPGIDAASSQAALDLADQEPDRIVAAVGLHPHEADRWAIERAALGEMAPRAVAIGEIGLDFYRDLSPRHEQEQAFVDQLTIAAELDLPAVVHCRDAFARIHELIESTGTGERVVMHCWTGGPRWSRRFLDLGVMISFAGPVAFETGDTVRRAADVVPPGRAMVETDTPYLSPPPYRGEPNEPARVALVGAALGRVWGMPVEDVAGITAANARRVFRS